MYITKLARKHCKKNNLNFGWVNRIEKEAKRAAFEDGIVDYMYRGLELLLLRDSSRECFIPSFIKLNRHVFISEAEVLAKMGGRDRNRELIRIRDDHTCQLCGKKWEEGQRRLDVHHIDCEKEKTRQVDNLEKEQHNLVTLCHKCHLNLPEHRAAQVLGHKISKQKKYENGL